VPLLLPKTDSQADVTSLPEQHNRKRNNRGKTGGNYGRQKSRVAYIVNPLDRPAYPHTHGRAPELGAGISSCALVTLASQFAFWF
jgi:hypothetical protein